MEQEKDHGAGLIHQVASPLAETEPRPNDVRVELRMVDADWRTAYAAPTMDQMASPQEFASLAENLRVTFLYSYQHRGDESPDSSQPSGPSAGRDKRMAAARKAVSVPIDSRHASSFVLPNESINDAIRRIMGEGGTPFQVEQRLTRYFLDREAVRVSALPQQETTDDPISADARRRQAARHSLWPGAPYGGAKVETAALPVPKEDPQTVAAALPNTEITSSAPEVVIECCNQSCKMAQPHYTNECCGRGRVSALPNTECSCGAVDPKSARYGNGHLRWCALSPDTAARKAEG